MIPILYIAQHIFSIFLLDRKTRFYYAIFALFLFFLIYLLKDDHYDIPHYIDLAKNPFAFAEIGFTYLLGFFYLFTNNPETVIRMTQFFIASLFLLYGYLAHSYIGANYKEIKRNSVLYVFIIVIMSVSFTLGVNNGLRQALSGIIALCSLLFLVEKRYIFSLLLALLAIFFHGSGIFFIALTFVLFFILKLFFFHNNLKIKFTPFLIVFSVTVLGVICGFLLKEFISYSDAYFNYSNKVLVFEGNERFLLYIKVLPILVIFLISEFLAGRYSVQRIHLSTMRLLRVLFLSIVITLSFFAQLDELGSRILYYYFLIEMAVIIFYWLHQHKFAAVFIIFSYSLALNAIHILGGRLL